MFSINNIIDLVWMEKFSHKLLKLLESYLALQAKLYKTLGSFSDERCGTWVVFSEMGYITYFTSAINSRGIVLLHREQPHNVQF